MPRFAGKTFLIALALLGIVLLVATTPLGAQTRGIPVTVTNTPLPVVVTGTPGPKTMVTLAENQSINGEMDLPSIDVRGYTRVVLLGLSSLGRMSVEAYFATDPGTASDPVAKSFAGSCEFSMRLVNCDVREGFRVSGPFLMLHFRTGFGPDGSRATDIFTLKGYLTND
jgi:hypothetical protein